jgi:plasmid stabilization system protein ParE
MREIFNVTISQRAQDNLINILYYLEVNWSERIKTGFLKRLIKLIGYIKENPYLFPISEYGQDVRRCMITKHNILYYRIINNTIEIITIHDVRQNPDNFQIE